MKLICLEVGYDLLYQKLFESRYKFNLIRHNYLKKVVF